MNTMKQLMTALLLLICIEGYGGAGPNQNICQNGGIVMAATGTGSWSALQSNPATTGIFTPTSATTIVDGFTVAGTYGFKWGTAIGDTMYVTVKPAPARPVIFTHGGCLGTETILLNGSAYTNTVEWLLNGTPVYNSGLDSSYTPTATGLYTAYLTAPNGCQSSISDTVSVDSCISAGPNQTICQGSTATMVGTGTGMWTASSGNLSTVNFTNANSPTTTVTGLDSVGVYTLIYSNGLQSDTVLVTVYAIAAPQIGAIASATSFCGISSVDTFTATYGGYTGTSPSYRWYRNGISVGTNSSTYIDPAPVNGESVWVVMTSNQLCASPDTAVSGHIGITIIPTPSAPVIVANGGLCLGSDSLALSGQVDGLQLNWYRNGAFDTTTSESIKTVAANGLYGPSALVVDASGNIYVTSFNRILKFPAGSTGTTTGTVIAGGNGNGGAANQLWYANGICFDASGNLYVADQYNNRVQKFPAGSTSATNGVTVAGGNGAGNAANQFNGPSGVWVDASGNIYIVDENNARVQKFPAGSTSATSGTTVAGGGGYGGGANQLANPHAIYGDAAGNIYIADYSAGRIQKYPPGSTSSTNGVTVAANHMDYPAGVFVDASGNIYEAGDASVQKFPSNSTSTTTGIVVAGSANTGSAMNQLSYSSGIFVDGSGNIYVTDGSNRRIQKYTPGIDFKPRLAGVYTATYTDVISGCSSAVSDTVTVTACLDSVWPGDADANRMVDNNDLLTIGLGYGSTGPVRVVQGIVWQGDVATDWANYFTIYAPTVNFNHADCNGDGIINADDTLAIVTNFGDTHAKTGNLPGLWRGSTPGISLLFSEDTVSNGDTLTTSIILGSTSVSVNNIYGLAFTFNYDTRVDTLGSFSFISSWLGTAANSININRNFTSTGAVKAAITGINHTSRSGNGEIATFRCIITTDNINGKNLSYYPNSFYISDIRAIDQYGDTIPLNAGLDTNYVAFTPNGIRDISQTAKVTIYPNPASTYMMVKSGAAMSGITITDMLGQEVLVQKVNSKQSEIIDISNLGVGVYIVHVSTISGESTAKLIISR